MKTVSHENTGMQFRLIADKRLSQQFLEVHLISVASKDAFTPIAADAEMIKRVFRLNARRSCNRLWRQSPWRAVALEEAPRLQFYHRAHTNDKARLRIASAVHEPFPGD